MATLTPAEVLQAVAEATMTLQSKRVKIFTVKDGEDGPELNGTLAQYVVWSVAGVLEEKHIGDGDTETKGALKEQLKTSLDEFEEEVEEGYHAAGLVMGRFGGAKTTRRRKAFTAKKPRAR